MNSIWLTWERQTRNESMARLLGSEYHEMISKHKGAARYLELSARTAALVFKKKPKIIYFQNPSIVLALLCVLFKMLWGKKVTVVGDFHNCALDPHKFQKTNRFICRSIDITLITNSNLAEIVRSMGGEPFVFPDPIPVVHEPSSAITNAIASEPFILFISSWADDEPINEVCDAFVKSNLAGKSVKLLITGRVKEKRLYQPPSYYESKNIVFLGFVSEDLYWDFLKNSIFNIDLTTRDDCMVCGAYESVAVKNGVLLSNNQPTMNHFGDAAWYTDNSTEDLIKKMNLSYEESASTKLKAEKKLALLLNSQSTATDKLHDKIMAFSS